MHVLTNPSRGPNPDDHSILSSSIVEKLDDLMEHNGDGRNTHAMLRGGGGGGGEEGERERDREREGERERERENIMYS